MTAVQRESFCVRAKEAGQKKQLAGDARRAGIHLRINSMEADKDV
jgi:hypothetical protein